MDFPDYLYCHCCGWEGTSDDLEESDVCPECGQSGSLQIDG